MSTGAILNAEAQRTQSDAAVAFIYNESGVRICKLAPVVSGLPFLRKEQPIHVRGYVTTCQGPWLKLMTPSGAFHYLVADALNHYELRRIISAQGNAIHVENEASLLVRKPQRDGGDW